MSERYNKVMEERHKMVEQIIDNMKHGYIMPKPLWDAKQFQIHNPECRKIYTRASGVCR